MRRVKPLLLQVLLSRVDIFSIVNLFLEVASLARLLSYVQAIRVA
jgi:hypothetical protein